MSEQLSVLPDYDSPWKEILDENFEECIEFFFSDAHQAIDWSKGYEFLDKELQQITADAAIGRKVVDKLVKVWLKDGREQWVLIHVEVQGRYEEDFELRLYVYHYRIFDRYGHHVATFAILTDEDPQWQPFEFRYELLGTVASLHFVTSKLIEYSSEWERLEASSNPFAVVVMAHLKTLESKRDPEVRYHWKWLLTRMLYDRGYDRQRIINLFRFIDWMMGLSADLQERFRDELYEFEETRRMPYITSIERIGLEKGRIEGLIEGRVEGHVKGRVEGRVEGKYQHALETVQRFAKHKFGELGDSIHMALTTLKLEDLDALLEALFEMESKQELIDWLKQAKKE